MRLQSLHHPERRHLLTLVVATFGASIIGGSLGLLLGSQADLLFNIDARIIGVVAGAVLGSLLPPARTLNPLVRAAAAGPGVILPILALVGGARVAPEVLWGMAILAVVCSGAISMIFRLVPTAIRTLRARR